MRNTLYSPPRLVSIMSAREVAVYRRRAETFLRHAAEALERREYDFASFSAEQASQLFVKAALLHEAGEVPRSHGLREMLGALAAACPEAKDTIAKFVSEKRKDLRIAEDAYIASRYLPTSYAEEDARALVELAEGVRRLTEEVEKGRPG